MPAVTLGGHSGTHMDHLLCAGIGYTEMRGTPSGWDTAMVRQPSEAQQREARAPGRGETRKAPHTGTEGRPGGHWADDTSPARPREEGHPGRGPSRQRPGV